VIIGFTSQKGGVGKSTLAVHALAWALREGIDACLIDTDPQASSSDWISDWDKSVKAPLITEAKAIGAAITDFNKKHELVFVDSRGALDIGSKATLLMADKICVPCRPSRLDFAGAVETLRLAIEASKNRSKEADLALVPVMVREGENMTHIIQGDLEQLGIPVLPSISNRASYAKAAEKTNFVWDHADAKASAEIEILMQEITER
jgi:chromosome partitioning protein